MTFRTDIIDEINDLTAAVAVVIRDVLFAIAGGLDLAQIGANSAEADARLVQAAIAHQLLLRLGAPTTDPVSPSRRDKWWVPVTTGVSANDHVVDDYGWVRDYWSSLETGQYHLSRVPVGAAS